MNTKTLLDNFRSWPWLLGALVATIIIAWQAPHQITVLVWSLCKLSWGAYLGYWIDRSVFHYARPGSINVNNANEKTARLIAWCMVRRAVIMAAAIMALGLGV